MMQGPIRKTVLHRVEQRNDEFLPSAWIGEAAEPAAWKDGRWLTRTSPPMAAPAEAPVLAFLGNDWGDDQTRLIADAAEGARVYVLVGPGWGKDQADSQLLQVPRVLVRRIPEVPASAIHVGSEARLWIGGGFILRLDAAQAEALRQNFLRLFWHEASEEAWSEGGVFAWRPARDRPFDIPELPQAAPVRRDPAEARLANDARGSLVHLNAGPAPDSEPRRLWFPAGPDHHPRLTQLDQAGVEVLWSDRGLPDIQIAAASGEMLLSGKHGRLRIRLTDKQAGEVGQLLDALPAWRFHTNIRLGDAIHRSARFWLAGEGAAHELESEQRMDVPEVQATSLRAVPDTAPTSVPAAQPLALVVRYQWTVVPPRVPVGAQEDALVGSWRKLDEDWIARLKRAREALVSSEGERTRIGSAFSRLASAMLGFQRTHGGLLARVGTLEAQLLSRAGPSEAPALLDQLAEIEDATRKLQTNLDDAERKAREDVEREKQLSEWQGRVDSAKKNLPERKKDLGNSQNRCDAIHKELRGIDESMKSADKEAGKDLKAKKSKLSDELQREEKAFKQVENVIINLKQKAAELFVFRPPSATAGRQTQSGGRFVPPASGSRAASDVPHEALPEVGSLRNHKGQRFLVIQTWEQLPDGEDAAIRLSAQLVAPENV